MLYGKTETIDFTAEGSDQFTTDNLFTIAPYGWKAEVAAATRALSTPFTLTVTAPANATSGAAEGEILVMLDNQQGNTTIGRLTVKAVKYVIEGTELTAFALESGELAEAIGNRTNLTSITVKSGTLNKADWDAIKKSKGSLVTIDLAGATYTGDDSNSWVYKGDNSYSNQELTTIKLPQGITALGVNAFYLCTALTEITLPETLTSIGSAAFYTCSVLTTIDLPEGLTSIGDNAFNHCYALQSITLPEGLKSIEDWTFSSSALTTIDLPAGLESIGDNAFWGCTALTTINLPETLTSIGEWAFYYCEALTTITCLAETPPTLGSWTFDGCDKLSAIYVPILSVDDYQGATNWSNYATIIKSILEKPQ